MREEGRGRSAETVRTVEIPKMIPTTGAIAFPSIKIQMDATAPTIASTVPAARLPPDAVTIMVTPSTISAAATNESTMTSGYTTSPERAIRIVVTIARSAPNASARRTIGVLSRGLSMPRLVAA